DELVPPVPFPHLLYLPGNSQFLGGKILGKQEYSQTCLTLDTLYTYIMTNYYIRYNDGYDAIWITKPDTCSVETVKDLKCFLQSNGLYNENTQNIAISSTSPNRDSTYWHYYQFKCDDYKLNGGECYILIQPIPNPPILSAQLTSLSEESDQKCRQLCEKISTLKASNECEVNALKAQLKTAIHSMETMTEEINHLKQSDQQMVTDLSQVLTQNTSGFSEEMSALKASNESEVKALKAQLKTSNDSMDTQIKVLRQKFSNKEVKDWIQLISSALLIICLLSGVCIVSAKVSALSEELSTLKQRLSSNTSDPKMVAQFSELWANKSCLTEELLALNTSNGYQVIASQLKSAMDSIQTMEKEINELREMFLISDNSYQTVATDLRIITINGLSDWLSVLKPSNHTINSDVTQLAQQINAQNLRNSMSDSSSSSSSIGSHNEMTTNSDETRDEINIRDMFKKIENQIKSLSHMTYTLLKALVIESDLSVTTLDVRQSAEDSDDSESIVVVDSHHE
ncbi:unnamed protein product, partial [Medioppia subpectinata]